MHHASKVPAPAEYNWWWFPLCLRIQLAAFPNWSAYHGLWRRQLNGLGRYIGLVLVQDSGITVAFGTASTPNSCIYSRDTSITFSCRWKRDLRCLLSKICSNELQPSNQYVSETTTFLGIWKMIELYHKLVYVAHSMQQLNLLINMLKSHFQSKVSLGFFMFPNAYSITFYYI